MTETTQSLDIAIVGISCAYPGADTPEQFWRNIRDGVESLTRLSDEDLAAAGVDPALSKAPNYVKVAASIDGIDQFDAGFFGMSPREAELMDPQQRLFLEHCWRSVEAAGYDPTGLDVPVGVYAGAGVNTYVTQVRSNVDVQALNVTGEDLHDVGSVENDLDYLTTRVSYKLNLTGPSINISTACSTSLVAVHMAAQGLRSFECDMALAGGVAVSPPVKSGYLYREGAINSFDGRTRSFDSSSTGTVLGSGVGVLLLKRLEDALEDGDVIHAVITGSAVNNDGADKAGFTAPGVPGQAEVTATAHAVAGISADTVTYQEAHGTGTRLGDPIEVQALTRAFRETTDATDYCALGSVKANIGHMDTAAGVAGVIKAALATKNAIIPPQINYETPNPGLQLESSPFYIGTEAQDWDTGGRHPRRAGVSAFGFGGTNAHVVVEQPPARVARTGSGDWQVLPVSARDDQAVGEYLGSLSAWLADPAGREEVPLDDVAATLQVGRTRFGRRAAVLARSAEEAESALRARAALPYGEAAADPEIAFLFPGQGSQHALMGLGLYRNQPVFRTEFDRCADLFAPSLGVDLRKVLFESGGPEADHPVNRTRLTQPALFAVEYAMARTLAAFGVVPAVMIGHSLGEIVAATVAGVFTVEDAVRVVAERAALMEAAPSGAMLAVGLPAAEVEPLLPEGVSIAAYNAPRLVVATGADEGVDALAAELSARGVNPRRLRVSCASHSVLMEEPAREFVEFLRGIPMTPPSLPLVSNVTGELLTAEEACDPEYWGRHLRGAVHFTQGLERLTATVGGPLLEVGPGGGLLSLARADKAASRGRALIPTMRHPKDTDDDTRVFLGALATLWENGVEPDWTGGEPRSLRRVTLPTYPFQRRRYWIDSSTEEELRLSRRLLERQEDPSRWFYAPSWRRTAGARYVVPTDADGWAAPQTVLLVTDKAAQTSGLADRLAEHIRAQNTRCVVLADAERYLRRSDDLVDLCTTDAAHYQLALAEEETHDGRTAVVFLVGGDGARSDPMPAALALLSLGRAMADTERSGELVVVTHGAFDVLGDEDPAPGGWLLDGMARVLPREIAGLSCRVVDIDPGEDPGTVARDLTRELSTHQPDSVVAYRRGRRWQRGTEALVAGAASGLSRQPRPGGAYLITGGLGGIGLSLAEFLAERYGAKLVLTGTSPFPDSSDWDAWIAEHGDRDRTSRRIQRLRRIEKRGGEVLALASDACDAVAVRDLVARAEQRFGRIDGIVHAAGLPGGGLVQALGHEDFAKVLAPKVLGGRHLLQATEGMDLDFLMLFSSLNVVDGRFGIADYTAANSYLDGLAHQAWRRGRTEVIAVDWTGWRDLGMALDAGSTAEGNEELREMERLTIMSEAGLASFMSEEESHEAFLRALGLGLPQVHVSTQDLHAVVEQGRRLDVATALEALTRADRRRGAYERPEIAAAYEPPSGARESFVCETLQLLLGIEKVGATDDFFELGGNSLLALDVVARVKRRFDAEVPVGRFLAQPTPRGMALLISEQPAPVEAS